MKLNISTYTPSQLKLVDNAFEAFIFKQLSEEPFEESYKANPRNFRKFINNMVAFKKALDQFFKEQYQDRYRLFSVPGSFKFDQYDEYLYGEEWKIYQEQLARILAEQKTKQWDLGAIALAIGLSIISDINSSDFQKAIAKDAWQKAGDITTTTQNRVKQAIAASMKLGENRQQFEDRIQKIFINPWRGRFIAHEESINAYMQGKYSAALDQSMQYKMCLSAQAKDNICGDYNGEVVPINGNFGNGMPSPQFHFGCRCDLAYSASPDGPWS